MMQEPGGKQSKALLQRLLSICCCNPSFDLHLLLVANKTLMRLRWHLNCLLVWKSVCLPPVRFSWWQCLSLSDFLSVKGFFYSKLNIHSLQFGKLLNSDKLFIFYFLKMSAPGAVLCFPGIKNWKCLLLRWQSYVLKVLSYKEIHSK